MENEIVQTLVTILSVFFSFHTTLSQVMHNEIEKAHCTLMSQPDQSYLWLRHTTYYSVNSHILEKTLWHPGYFH